MNILPTTGSQVLKIVPRKDASNPVIKLTNKDTNKTVTVTPTKTDDGQYMVLTGTFTLTEDTLYRYVVELSSSNTEENYRGLIFATNQSNLEKYFVSNNLYTEEDSYDNEFVFI